MEEIENVQVIGVQENQVLRTNSRLETFANTGDEYIGLETGVNVHSRPQFREEIASNELINARLKDKFSNVEVINAHELESYHEAELAPSANEEKKQRIVSEVQEWTSEVAPVQEQVAEVVPVEEQVPEVLPVDEQILEGHATPKNAYVKRSFSRIYSAEMDTDDEKLREYWTHALQTSTSSSEIVEEIVKVLKNHQNTHDLMCPACGSCVTRTIILRKRKRSSQISVERWYPETLLEESKRRGYPEDNSSPECKGEDTEVEAQDIEQVAEVYGCLTCFSLFFQEGYEILTKRETFECFPFLCPPYPWSSTDMDSRNSGIVQKGSIEKVRSKISTQNIAGVCDDTTLEGFQKTGSIQYSESKETRCVGVFAPALLPTYPWGPSHISADDLSPQSVDHDTENSYCTCGLGSVFLPEYSRGTVSEDKATPRDVRIEKASRETSTPSTVEECGRTTKSVDQAESPQYSPEGALHTCGVVPALLPAYPWGSSPLPAGSADHSSHVLENKLSKVTLGCVDGASSYICESSVHDITANVLSHPAHYETKNTDCTCGLGSTVLPEYSWGILSKDEELVDVKTHVYNTYERSISAEDVAAHVSENFVAIGETNADDIPQSSACGLKSVLLPEYSWGRLSAVEELADVKTCIYNTCESSISIEDVTAHVSENFVAVGETNADDISQSPTCGLKSALLPEYSWGRLSKVEAAPQELSIYKATDETPTQNLPDLHTDTIESVQQAAPTDSIESIEQEGSVKKSLIQGTNAELSTIFLPAYPWGQSLETAAELADVKASVRERSVSVEDLTAHVTENFIAVGETADDIPQSSACGLKSVLLPEYSWGRLSEIEELVDVKTSVYNARERSVSVEVIAAHVSENFVTVGATKADDILQSSACGLKPVLLPEYSWGRLSEVGELPVVKTCVYNTCERSIGIEDVSAHASENFVAVGETNANDIPQSPACGLQSVLLPEYSWGRSSKAEANPQELSIDKVTVEACTQNLPDRHTDTIECVPQAGSVKKFEGTSCELSTIFLPAYPWGLSVETVAELVNMKTCVYNTCERSISIKDVTAHVSEDLIAIGKTNADDIPQSPVSGFKSALLPEYSWGRLSAVEAAQGLSVEEASDDSSCQNIPNVPVESIQSIEEVRSVENSSFEGSQPSTIFTPAYPWGVSLETATELDDVRTSIYNPRESSISVEDITALVSEASNAVGDIKTDDIPQSSAPGLKSMLLPEYSWGTFSEVAAPRELSIDKATDDTRTQNLPDLHTDTIESIQQAAPTDSIESIEQEGSVEKSLFQGTNVELSTVFLPAYPWGQSLETAAELADVKASARERSVSIEGLTVHVTENFIAVGETKADDIPQSSACGLKSVLLPEYSWGRLSEIEELVDVKTSVYNARERSVTVEDIAAHVSENFVTVGATKADDILKSSACGLKPVLLPEYSWGRFSVGEPADVKSSACIACDSSVRVEGITTHVSDDFVAAGCIKGDDIPQSSVRDLKSALLPEYSWGTFSDVGELTDKNTSGNNACGSSLSVEDIKNAVSENFVAVEDSKFDDIPQSSACGLKSVLLPEYSWGRFSEVGETPPERNNITENNETPPERNNITENNGYTCGIGTVLAESSWATFGRAAGQQICEEWRKLSSITVSQSLKSDSIKTEDADFTCGMGPVFSKYSWDQNYWAADQLDQTRSEQENEHVGVVSIFNAAGDIGDSLLGKAAKQSFRERGSRNSDFNDVEELSSSYKCEIETLVILEKQQERKETVQIIKHCVSQDLSTAATSMPSIAPSGVMKIQKDTSYINDLRESNGQNDSPKCETKTSVTIDEQPERKETVQIAKPCIGRDPSTAPACILSVASSDVMKVQGESSDFRDAEESNDESDSEQKRVLETLLILEEQQETVLVAKTCVAQDPSTEATKIQDDSRNQTIHTKSSSFNSPTETGNPEDITALPSVNEEMSYGFKISKFSDLTTPLLSIEDEIEDDIEVRVISDTAVLQNGTSREAKFWEILKPIVYGGLDISIASLGVISGAAGGNAITRTVVYMGLAALLSGLIVFYHNVINLYNIHRDHFTDVVGITIGMHGTIALISFVVFGALSPIIYAFSYRQTDDRDHKFILCCGVTVLTVSLLSLGKAKVSNKKYVRTLCAYLLVVILSSVVGYLTGEHVAEILDIWGF